MRDIVERLNDASYENAPSRCMEAAREIERLRESLKEIQREAMTLKPPRHSWYYDRAQNALTNSTEMLVRDGLATDPRS